MGMGNLRVLRQKLSDTTALKNHWRAVREKFKEFVCRFDGCSESFAQLADRKRHEERVHEVPRPIHYCGTCNEGFYHISHLRRHQREVHQALKAHKCALCDQLYTQKVSLELSRNQSASVKKRDQVGNHHGKCTRWQRPWPSALGKRR